MFPPTHPPTQTKIYDGFGAYPLRPEFAESLYYLYQITKDPKWLGMGRDMISSLQSLTRVECGFASIQNVSTNEQRDFMDSFFLSETLKYLYLLFAEEEDIGGGGGRTGVGLPVVDVLDTVFTTEAHPISRRRLKAMEVERTTPPVTAEGGDTVNQADKVPHPYHLLPYTSFSLPVSLH